MTSEYRFASIGELGVLLRARRASASELAQEALSLVEALGPRYNALANVLPERALREAQLADVALAGYDASPLCGVPYGVKDLFAAVGGPTTWGSPMYREQVFPRDAKAIQRLAAQGAVLVAKLAMSELAGGGQPSRAGASLHGQGRNPWDAERYSGGSSSGSAIAVAVGVVPFALGTETGGSIVGPAAFSGVTGLRPTFGRVPRDGVMTLSWSLDKVGPLARSAADCAIVMDAIANRRGRSAGFVKGAEEMQDGRRDSIRVAFTASELEEASPSIRGALAGGIEEFRGLFPTFVDAELTRDGRYITALEDIVRVEGSFEFRDQLTRAGFHMSDEQQQSKLASGLDVPAIHYLDAVRNVRAEADRAFVRVFARADIILSASRPAVAQRLDGVRSPRDATKMSDLLRAAANLAGIPGVSIPCGLSDEGLPVGLHILGPRGSDATLLGVASVFQGATAHHLLHPPDPRRESVTAG
jgi:aspartyl-tRNA(Asn)/glutamyl-tRNA(Gln) amidotransferase subunit A